MLSSEAAPDAVTLCPGNKTFFTISQEVLEGFPIALLFEPS